MVAEPTFANRRVSVMKTVNRYIWFLAVSLIALTLPSNAYAECAINSHGEVICGAGRCLVDIKGKIWCSRHFLGGAVRTRNGDILCGKGQCVRNTHGQVYCSSVNGGAALTDSRGKIRCYGRCLPATKTDCERSLAGSSP